MQIDIKKAFKFPFTENDWIQKLVIGSVFYFVSISISSFGEFLNSFIKHGNRYNLNINPFEIILLLIFIIFLTLVSAAIKAIPAGYVLQSVHNEINNDNNLLPDWDSNFMLFFKRGLYLYLIGLIYTVSAIFILAIPTAIGFTIFFMYRNSPQISFIGIAFALAIIIPVVLFYILVIPFIQAAYAENFCFKDAFKLDRILVQISKVFPDYLVIFLISVIVIPVMYAGILFAFAVTCIGICLLPFAIPFLMLPAQLIVTNLFAQAYRIAKSK